MRRLLAALAVCLVSACSSLDTTVQDIMAPSASDGARWGILVTDDEGKVLLEHRADERFIPASNTKIVTTMAGLRARHLLELPDLSPGTRLFTRQTEGNDAPDLILVGGGDPFLGDGPQCERTCLAELADRVIEAGLSDVRNIVGDDSLFPYEPWPPGWSQEDLRFDYGAPVSALTVNGNSRKLVIAPGDAAGDPAQLRWENLDDFGGVEIQNRIRTGPAGTRPEYGIIHFPGGDDVDLFGVIPEDSAERRLEIVVPDPPRAAAERLADLLQERGVTIRGEIVVQSRSMTLRDDPDWALAVEAAKLPVTPSEDPKTALLLAALPPVSFVDSLRMISEDSDNLHAELLLRRLGLVEGTGSRAHGLAQVRTLLEAAGIREAGITLHDGSGLSVYNRVTPRAMVRLLIFALREDWGPLWRDLQPVAGRTGTLAVRYRGTALEGRMQAKTGRMSSVDALSGYMTAASGRLLVFSVMANDLPPETGSVRRDIDALLLEIAERY